MKYEEISGPRAVRRILEANNGTFPEAEVIKIMKYIYGESDSIETIECMVKNDVIWRTYDGKAQVLLHIY